jgi:hypothetical protein
MAEKESALWLTCAKCGYGSKSHRILCEKEKYYLDGPDGNVLTTYFHRFVQCMGCESYKYATSERDETQFDPQEENFTIFPDAPGTSQRRVARITDDEATGDDGKMLIPEIVWKMYKETIDALNAKIRTLAGGGLRATVEAICLHGKIAGNNLNARINELAAKGLLTTAQADLLHEERYLGNDALHEMLTPSAQDIEDGLDIVEGLMTTIYILPAKAKRLKDKRTKKKPGK